MEALNSIPPALALTIGALIGFVIGWFSRSGSVRKGEQSAQSLAQSTKEMDDYRQQVTDHFEKTAMLVGQMTEQYRAVYDHLADGASSLCNDPEARLDRIGQDGALIAHAPAKAESGEDVADTEDASATGPKHQDESVATDNTGAEKRSGPEDKTNP